MPEKIYPGIIHKELMYSIPGFVYFLYLLFPFRFWELFVFSNQTEPVVITVYFACVLLLFILSKARQTLILRFTKTDLILVIYGIYLLFRLNYPLEKEYLFIAFSIGCIYLYFRNFPENYFKGLLFLLPAAVIAQLLDGVYRFTMPWQNLSHITGAFHNPGLFGGFAALGLVVCLSLLFFSDSGKWHSKSIAFTALGVILTIQTYASGSRASWIAALIAIFFLLYQLVPKFRITSL